MSASSVASWRAGVGSVVSPQRKSAETPRALAEAVRLATDRLARPLSTIEIREGVLLVPPASRACEKPRSFRAFRRRFPTVVTPTE